MNFIIFNPDEMRAESLHSYRHPLVRTPHMDELAGGGVRFEQAHVQHTVCSPSRCSFMTGWYPHVGGHRTLWHMLRRDEPNLLRYLKQAGYEVAWFGRNDLLAPESFADSVDVIAYSRGSGESPARPFEPDQPGYQSFLYEPQDATIEDLGDMRNVRAAIEFLKRAHDRPFMLYLPLALPHCPYTVPQPYYDMYDPDKLPPLRPPRGPDGPDFHDLIRSYRRLDEVDEGVFRKINAVYHGMISCVDDMLGELLKALEESNLAGETTVLLFSDHGDWAGDYGLVEKWPSALDDCLTRVPLIIRTPGGAAGHVVAEPVEVMDIMATILELAGVEAAHTHSSRSLVPQLGGAPGDPDRAVFAEGGYDTSEPRCFEGRDDGDQAHRTTANIYYLKGAQQQEHPESVCRSTMIRTATHKLIHRTSRRHELYDLEADPRELRNVYDDPALAQVRSDLEERMLDWLIRTSDVTPFDEDPRGMPEGKEIP